jgi:hypothetical protein
VAIKASNLILAASLTANAVLVAVVAIDAPGVFHFGQSIPAESAAAAVRHAAQPDSLDGNPDARKWATMKGEDLKSLVAGLRAAGFPPRVIRAIAKAQLDDQLHAQRKELVDQLGSRPYWSQHYGVFDAKTLMSLGAISRHETKELNDLLGPDENGNNPPGVTYTDDATAGLSRKKYERIQAIGADFTDMRYAIIGGANGLILPEDQEKLNYLAKERQAEINAELSPDEQFEYQLRTSNMANQLRYTLSTFNPTEDEFRAIFKAQQDFDSQYGSSEEQLTPDQQKEKEAHKADLFAKIQDAIGPERAAEYKVQSDPNYIQLSRLVDRLELPTAATQQVASVQSDITKRADAIRKDPELSATDKASQLAALADEATGEITTVMGDRGMAAYKQNGGGWLQVLKPPSN